MRLHADVRGHGRPLLAIHGWGLNGGVFTHAGLERLGRVTAVDLPGAGHSPAPARALTLTELAAAADASLDGPAVWIGWSLGGLIALHAAVTRPDRVRALILVASTPRFVQAADWPHAQAPAVLEAFARSLETDLRRTLARFLALQVRGSEAAQRGVLAELRAALASRGDPDPRALRHGLEVLSRSDLRHAVPRTRCPVLAVLGGRDTLAPPGLAADLAALNPTWRVQVIAGAGHVPFLSHRTEFLAGVEAFVDAHA